MRNIIARLPGQPGGRLLVVSGHTDTKKLAINFVGANDAGSSTGFLLELARAFRNAKLKHDLVLVFFDGEEAIRDWSDTDSLYGSRRLAGRWHKDGTIARINALINVDMIGDRDLVLLKESYSSEPLQSAGLGQGKSSEPLQRSGLGLANSGTPATSATRAGRSKTITRPVSSPRRARHQPDRLRLRPEQLVVAHR
jgi:hypothetical protein